MMSERIAWTMQVEQVTVYPDRARVTNRATMQLTIETTSLLFDDLPLVWSRSRSFWWLRGGGAHAGIDVVRRH